MHQDAYILIINLKLNAMGKLLIVTLDIETIEKIKYSKLLSGWKVINDIKRTIIFYYLTLEKK